MSPAKRNRDSDDSDVVGNGDAKVARKDNHSDEGMMIFVYEDDESNDDDDDDEGNNGDGGVKVNENDNGDNKESEVAKPVVEEPPAGPATMIEAEDENLIYFYGRNDPNRTLYSLPLEKADTWLALRRYLGPLVSQHGRFKIYTPDDRQIFEVWWKPYPKVGKIFSFTFCELVNVTIMSTNSTAHMYDEFSMTITERTRVHELRSLIQCEMRAHYWRTPENADYLELDVFGFVDNRPVVAKMIPSQFIFIYLQGKCEQLTIKVRNMEAWRNDEWLWPEWNERMFWRSEITGLNE